jgi:hypothetical protein
LEIDEVDGLPIVSPTLTARPKKRRLVRSELLDIKRQNQNELIEIKIYKERLECLKLERELQLHRSDYTKDLPRLPFYTPLDEQVREDDE